MELRRRDNDRKKIWAGTRLTQKPDYTVTNLQTELNAVGTYADKIDGDFGKKTERALRIFQWCLKHTGNVIQNNKILAYTASPGINTSGVFDADTRVALNNWVAKGFRVTGDLVRISPAGSSNIRLGPGFKHIGKPVVKNTEFVISRAALPMIELMRDSATKLKLIISLNQALRIHGVEVTGSVVPPATKSQHLIGRAIDCNIIDGANWNTSSDFRKNRQTDNAMKFIQIMKSESYRWGGDFSNPDSPHFDVQLDASLFDYDASFFLNQTQISSGDPIEALLLE